MTFFSPHLALRRRTRLHLSTLVLLPVEVISLISSAWWALTLFIGHPFHTSPDYAAMAHVANESTWGAMALLLTAFQLVVGIWDVPKLRSLSHLCMVFWWFYIAADLFQEMPFPPGIGVYMALGVGHMLLYLGSRHYDFQRR